MVGHHLHTAFKTWFKDTESDGTPVLPYPLSKKYTITDKVLGQGSFALVKLVQVKATGEDRALKIIAKKPLKEGNEKMLKDEIAILGRVEHPHIIKMWDLYETKEAVFIVTDLCRGGELFDRLVEKVHYNELDARHITRQMFEGIDYLHDHEIIHRDLKPENILLREKSEPSQIVISDFGLSRFIPEDGHMLMTACGSPQYVAPEVLLGKGYDAAVDIWSGGVIAYCLLAGYTPFYGEDQPTLFQQILAMKVEFEPEYWGDVSDTARDFILRCLCPREKRMTAKEALAHPYLADLPPIDGKDSPKGASLKESAKRHQSSKGKFNRVVTTVEAANYLQHLHELRKTHSRDIHPERLHSLLRLATHLSNHSTTSTITGHENNGKKEEDSKDNRESKRFGDSGMSLDLVVMSAFVPDASEQLKNLPRGGTAAVSAAADATQHGENSAKIDDSVDNVNKGSTDSPTPPGSEYSDATATPSRTRSPESQARRSSRPSQKSRRHRSGSTKSSKTLDALLDQYKGSALPTTARSDPTAQPVKPEGMTLSKVWRYVPFLVNTTYSIGSALASHAIYGPPKKSWGIEMSIFTRIMRDTAKYSEFATISGMQQFFDLSSFLPVPKDGLITPVTYRVKKRNLRGLLKEADAAEDGTRELTGEWVVGKQTWRRLQSEWRNGKSTNKERVILYIHGGAYFVMSAVTHRPLTIALSKYTECRLFAVNYRLAPDCQFPGPLHDVVSSWFRLVDDLGIPPSNIVLGGDSAGGGLTLALLYYLRDNKYELPSGAILFSPWVDLTMSCDSWETNAAYDYLPLTPATDHMNPVRAYLGDKIEQYITHPYASPLFGDLRGLPPLLIQCGDAEALRDEVTLLAHKASIAGVAVRHELYEDCVHVFQAFLFLDASRKALQSARHFVRTALEKRGQRKADLERKSRSTMDDEMRKGMENEDGEIVDAKTGEKPGSSQDLRGGVESDSENLRSVHDRSDDEWNDFDDDVVRKSSSSKSSSQQSKSSSADLARSKSQPHAPARDHGKQPEVQSSKQDPRYRQESAPTTPHGQHGERSRPNRTSSSASLNSYSMSLEQARSRAQAGMRMQESRDAPQLARFHALNKPLQPKMRRTASNATINNLIQSWETEHGSSGLNTRVYSSQE
ncbi:Pkinase-domain-containing protein [Meira miltonrushii]|uniref:phosphorylase kinase n=1 Tax=Meira miltonrushii TaxID=1280837 RepID=A0A316VAW1_9BASI|nr:Pkinase-domain-containing protein [Meira miltonrushii]PWN34652.1 Pkinase-domain-containing protein [Meira miltonrushii]